MTRGAIQPLLPRPGSILPPGNSYHPSNLPYPRWVANRMPPRTMVGRKVQVISNTRGNCKSSPRTNLSGNGYTALLHVPRPLRRQGRRRWGGRGGIPRRGARRAPLREKGDQFAEVEERPFEVYRPCRFTEFCYSAFASWRAAASFSGVPFSAPAAVTIPASCKPI